jgi:hypothetical protein
MAHALPTGTRIDWMWKLNSNPFSHSELDEWHCYTEVETAIIEDALSKKLPVALLDDYHINFTHLIQIFNRNMNNQRPVKRMINKRVGSRLREKRLMPTPMVSSIPLAPQSNLYFIM